MAELTIRKQLWKRFTAAAQKQRQKPETVAERLLRDYVARVADEELLTRSASAARRAGVRGKNSLPYGRIGP
ncbi:MAG TPA: hypothetical protein VGX76_12125 [Pirellulales bacterium]|jgi:hypothetical protein|nr:hypothetical protein [Pirellulales bacterium]